MPHFLIDLVLLFLSFFSGLVIYPCFIKYLLKISAEGQPIYKEALPSHISKIGTPSLGGLIIVVITILFISLFSEISFELVAILATLLMFGLIGFIDDFLKLKYKNTKSGLSAKMKITMQFVSAIFIVFFIDNNRALGSFTLFTGYEIDIGIFYHCLAVLAIVGTSNAFNLTDGLDGLAIFPFIVHCIFFFIVSLYRYKTSGEDFLIFMTLNSVVIGSSLSFLWFNVKKASIFMGDTGSLPLGALLALSSILLRCEIPFIINSSLFIIEALSVILQVGFFRITKGRRLFIIAPIHHHFEKLGIDENKIVVRSWILCILMSALSLYLFFYNK